MKALFSILFVFFFAPGSFAANALTVELDTFNMGHGFVDGNLINTGTAVVNLSNSDLQLTLAQNQYPDLKNCQAPIILHYTNQFELAAEAHSSCNVVGHYGEASNGDRIYFIDASQATCPRSHHQAYKIRLVTHNLLKKEIQSVMYGEESKVNNQGDQ